MSTTPTSHFFEQLQQATIADRESLYQIDLIRRSVSEGISLELYQAFLTQAYHHVKHTVPLLMACGSRLPECYRWLQNAVAEYIEEELGHEEWILNDLAHCGLDKEQVRSSAPDFNTRMMVAYAYHLIDRVNPLAFFGMVHVLEGTSTALASEAASQIDARLGLGRKGFTYLNSHGALDLEHVEFFKTLMNRISDPADQADIIDAARQMYRLYGNIFRSLEQNDPLRQVA